MTRSNNDKHCRSISDKNQRLNEQMTRVLADNPKTWKTAQDRPVALEVILLKQTYVLPWNQFLYAKGSDDEIRIAFATHDVLVRGGSLHSLLADLAVQWIAQLQEPSRADGFEEAREAFIREISVTQVDAGRL
jgi:hypothetical protein